MSVSTAEALGHVVVDRVHGATGHIVVAAGGGDNGEAAVAIWHVSPTGQPTGAWVLPRATLAGDATAAGDMLRLTSHRALVAWDPGAAGVRPRVVHHATG